MRITLGPDVQPPSTRSYLDSADDIIALPPSELLRISRLRERVGAHDDAPLDGLYEIDRIYGLASQI